MERPIPLRFEPNALRKARLTSLYRAIFASAQAALDKAVPASEILARQFPSDKDAQILLSKSAVTPTKLSALPSVVMADVLTVLGPTSAAATLLARGLQLSFDHHATISVPKFMADADAVGFVQEGHPIPVRQLLAETPIQLTPSKLAAILTFTQEMLSASNVEQIVGDCLMRSAGLGLDKYLFDQAPGDSSRPAGIRNGIAAEAASTATDPATALLNDLSKLAGKVSALGGPITYIAAHTRANLMRLKASNALDGFSVLGTIGVAATDLLAVATDALASSLGGIDLDTKRSATLHEETAPLPLSTPGTPPTVAAPTRSLWQTDSVSVKVRLAATWALRDSRGVSWTTGVAW
jgi:Phage capsid family